MSGDIVSRLTLRASQAPTRFHWQAVDLADAAATITAQAQEIERLEAALKKAGRSLMYPVATEIDRNGYGVRTDSDTAHFVASIIAAAIRKETK